MGYKGEKSNFWLNYDVSTGAAAFGTSWDEATLNSQEIKPVAIAIIKLRLSEGNSQSVSRKIC